MTSTTSTAAPARGRKGEEGSGAAGPDPLAAALAEYLVHLEVERGLIEHTVSAYRRDLRRYAAYLAGSGVHGLDDVD